MELIIIYEKRPPESSPNSCIKFFRTDVEPFPSIHLACRGFILQWDENNRRKRLRQGALMERFNFQSGQERDDNKNSVPFIIEEDSFDLKEISDPDML